MENNIRYAHTNIIARDWKRLVKFYIDVFGCEPVFPERDLSGEWLDRLTGIKGASIRGMHLRLPGFENGPTLEIFEYNTAIEKDSDPLINHQGLGHIAFRVDHVEALLNRLLAHGGSKYGEMVQCEIACSGTIQVIYTRDPEGNIIEIQHWDK
jgi:catechol 2,3-dioxygenase-like lactoylglutathione lyase family enzyme